MACYHSTQAFSFCPPLLEALTLYTFDTQSCTALILWRHSAVPGAMACYHGIQAFTFCPPLWEAPTMYTSNTQSCTSFRFWTSFRRSAPLFSHHARPLHMRSTYLVISMRAHIVRRTYLLCPFHITGIHSPIHISTHLWLETGPPPYELYRGILFYFIWFHFRCPPLWGVERMPAGVKRTPFGHLPPIPEVTFSSTVELFFIIFEGFSIYILVATVGGTPQMTSMQTKRVG